MSVSANYSQPVAVNGYICWNCHQVAEAKQGVNPDGASSATSSAGSSGPVVLFGGSLARPSGAPNVAATPSPATSTTGQALDILA